MDRVALFSGCLIPYREPGLEKAARAVLLRLGFEPAALGFNCCGARMVESVSDEAWLALSARNMALARAAGLELVTLCGSCTGTMLRARNRLEDPAVRDRINSLLAPRGLEYSGAPAPIHLARLLVRERERIGDPGPVFPDHKAALSVPCQLVRPESAAGLTSGELVALVAGFTDGLEVLPQCCGSTVAPVDPDAARALLRANLEFAAGAGCRMIVTACGNCQFAYDYSQRALNRGPGLPSVGLPQLAGLALGLDPGELGLDGNRIRLPRRPWARDAAPEAGCGP